MEAQVFNFHTEGLEFNEEKHLFTVDGVVKRSVTQVLKDCGLVNTKFFTEQGRENGSRRHLVTELYDRNTLDWGTVDPEDLPYLEAWITAKEQLKIEIKFIEQKMYHPVLGYAGIVDRLCLVDRQPTVLDIKTGSPMPATKLQLPLYGLMVETLTPIKHLIIYLKANSRFTPVWVDKKDQFVAMGAARVSEWKVRHGL